jgi:hypothetical protein
MSSKVLNKILPYMIISSLLLSGCGREKAECLEPNEHVHLYTKEMYDGTVVSRYQECEYLNDYRWTWNEEHINLNNNAACKMYDTLDAGTYYNLKHDNNLFDGIDNFDYLYNFMASTEDYLEYYYEYYETTVHNIYDDKGNVIGTYTTTERKDGWSTDRNHRGNNGKIRLCHYQFYGYKPLLVDGKWQLFRSECVDDIREVLEYYPYVAEDFSTVVTKTHHVLPIQLWTVDASDYYEDFNHPNLEEKTSGIERKRTR